MTSEFLVLLLFLLDLPIRILKVTHSTALQIQHVKVYGYSNGLGLPPSHLNSTSYAIEPIRFSANLFFPLKPYN